MADEGWMGVMPVGLMPPIDAKDLLKGIIKLPGKVVKNLPAPIRDFFPTKTPTKPKDEEFEKKHVLTLRDASDVVRKNLADFALIKELGLWIIANTSAAGAGGNPLTDKILAELKAKVLQQNNPRVIIDAPHRARQS